MAKATVRPQAARVMSRSEVSAIFGVSRSTITRWARQGRLPCLLTLGGHRRYLVDDVLRLIGESHVPSRPLPPKIDRRQSR